MARRRILFQISLLLVALIVGLVMSELAVRTARRFMCADRGDVLFSPHPVYG